MKLLLITLLITTQLLLAEVEVCGQSDETEATTSELLSAAKRAIDRNAAKLQSATAQGRIRHLRFQRDVEAPIVTLDADLWLVYASPNFRLHLQYVPHDARNSAGALQGATPEAASPLDLEQQTVLFDGKTVVTIERLRDGTLRGDIYFDFHKPNMLRMAGFPFQDPIRLWEEPLQIDRADLLNSHTTPLAGGGFLGVLDKDTYRLKYYFLSGFDYDLRRVSSYRLGEDIPFRDWHLNWQQSHGVHYVERLVRRINEATSPQGELSPTALSHDQIELEFDKFTVNPTIDPHAFELAALSLPEGTPFYDHRVNVNGKPKVVRWSQGKLAVDAN